jgi:uncharacterized iron-regulated membrane protein
MAALPLPSTARQSWVIVHRWAGLTMALFLIVAGATGVLLPWQESLTLASRPGLSRAAPPAPGARPLDGVTLAERAARQTGGRVDFVPLNVSADHVAIIRVAARTGQPPLGYDTVWVDPFSGAIRLKFRYAVLADGWQNIVPFLYQVHYSLALGAWGIWAFGIAALIWTLDCFVGFYLTLPVRRGRAAATSHAQQSWWSRWRPVWLIRKGARGHKFHVDLHRAGGLWLWPLLLVFAWSGVGFNLPAVHRPVMAAFGASTDFDPPALARPLDTPPLDMRAAQRIGRELIVIEGKRRGFAVEREGYVVYRPAWGLYGYIARTTLDRSHDDAGTLLWFNATNGRLVRFEQPLGATAADATSRWFTLLHMARVFGLPYRIFVSLLGLAVVVLSVTGILIWMKKRSARLLSKRRASISPQYPRRPTAPPE